MTKQTKNLFHLENIAENTCIKCLWNTKNLTLAAVIAAIYVALTLINPLSFGAVQFRVSEALTLLPILLPQSIPGLFVGVLISNLFSPVGVLDIIFGSLATLLAAIGTYKLRKKLVLATLSPVVVNGVIIGVLLYATGIVPALLETMLSVAFGELVVVVVLGLPMIKAIDKVVNKIK
ncbi:MAG: QueT transporter family protein [Eubacteriales bacterium]|nr:QueT transporter family protein [Eubacteriales bacterium]